MTILSTFGVQTIALKIMIGFCLLLIPGISIIYTYALFNVKCMSGNRVGLIAATNARDEEEDENPPDQGVNIFNQEQALREYERRRTNAQVRFDNQNFAGGLVEAG